MRRTNHWDRVSAFRHDSSPSLILDGLWAAEWRIRPAWLNLLIDVHCEEELRYIAEPRWRKRAEVGDGRMTPFGWWIGSTGFWRAMLGESHDANRRRYHALDWGFVRPALRK